MAVDGSSAYFPGDGDEDEDGGEEGFVQPGAEGFVQPNEGFENSPMSTNNRKRGSSTAEQSTASSPGKKSKSPVGKLMRGLLNTFSTDSEKSTQLMTELVNRKGNPKENKKSNILSEELTQCQRLAIKCGATECTVEYFCATHCLLISTIESCL
ncbi:hypothetical protein C2845_PM09G17420 [Panicum miliaceum]|uniref:Uncharacterized protein n=1 Tax=Panicum miliaceum TaxID=4540 RepID=A0A3L6S4U0_PANMI|nr:hypothetical protein C2845_PM09G17420 [Panicum miliaceum]